MEQTLDVALRYARDVLDEMKLYEVRVLCYQHREQYPRAVETTLRVLARLGAPLPSAPSQEDVAAALTATMDALRDRSTDSLSEMVEMTDAHSQAEMRLLLNTISSAYMSVPALFPLIVFRMVQLTIRHGLTGESAYSFLTYGLVQVSVMGDYDAGYRLGLLSFKVMERFKAEGLRAKIQHVFSLFVRHYKEPVCVCAAEAFEGIQNGLVNGDIEFACYSMANYSMFSFIDDETLTSAFDKIERLFAAAVRHKHMHSIALIGFIGRATERLMGVAAGTARFSSLAWEPEGGARSSEALMFAYIDRTVGNFLMGDPAEAMASASVAEGHIAAVASMVIVPLHCFYQSLACLAMLPGLSGAPHDEAMAKVEDNQRRAAEWAIHAPFNYAHRFYLVEAELERVRGRSTDAMRAYERAIVLGREAGFAGELSLIYELCAKFYLAQGLATIAHRYLRDAHHGYLRWGAKAVTARLEREFPEILSSTPDAIARSGADTSSNLPSANLDLETMLRAASAISKEIVLSDLLEKLLSLALENAGAKRAVLVLAEGDGLVIGAESSLGVDEVPLLSLESIETCARVPASIVNYVARTGTDVVIDNAAVDERFLIDAYVQRTRPGSVLCVPIANQGKLVGVLYLENSLATGVFSHRRVELVRVMAGQAAIAIENARLYQDLDNRVKERTQELRATNEELSITLSRLQETQKQLVVQEKLAALGALTSGIAHEIKNPLNFMVNFAQLSVSTADELLGEVEQQRDRFEPESLDDLLDLVQDLRENTAKIEQHGRRADGIVKAMLSHSRTGIGGGERREVDINALLSECVKVVAHELEAQQMSFAGVIVAHYDEALRPMMLSPQDIGRVIRNLLDNAVYAIMVRRKALGEAYQPSIRVSSRELGERVEIRIRDNGGGVPAAVREQVFVPFFTTRPAGEGTGLGLSLSHDIVVQGHGGTIDLLTEEDDYAEFVITLPRP